MTFVSGPEGATGGEENDRLAEEAELAKNKLFEEINAFNDQSVVVDQTISEPTDDAVLVYTVTEPTVTSGVTRYKVCGLDDDGQFEAMRRYQEFEMLRAVLVDRWPGVYVPAIPPKAGYTTKNTDPAWLEERRSLLERFLRELAQFKFIISSEEFKIFSRGAGEVLNSFKALPAVSPKDILDKFRANFSQVHEDQDQSVIGEYNAQIVTFSTFLRKSVQALEVSWAPRWGPSR